MKYNILVTGVGAIIGYGIITSLRNSKYETMIVGTDIYHDAVGQVWCDKFICAVPAVDDGYLSFLKKVIDENEIDLVFFGTEQEITKCFENKEKLGEYYKKLVINKSEVLLVAEDKWNTICFLKEHSLNYIPSSIEYDFEHAKEEYGIPLLLKPRKMYASKGIEIVYDRKAFDTWKRTYMNQFMVQKYVGDDEHEYTTSIFGFGNGEYVGPIIMKRKLSKAGATDKAVVEKNIQLECEIAKLVSELKPLGPTNFQYRYHEGKFLLLEINPRISSSTSIRNCFGYNEAEMCIDYFLEGKRPKQYTCRSGKAYRYITEVIEYDDCNNI